MLTKGEVVLEGVSADLADSDELMAAYLGGTGETPDAGPAPVAGESAGI